MKKRRSLWGTVFTVLAVFTVVFGLLLAACSDSSDNGDDPAPVPSDNWPELLPADWKTRDYDGWETWMSGVDPAKATAEAQQNLEAFMREHLAEMTRDGQEFWMSILKEYPGLDISNWPQGQDKNTYPSCYFRKSNDGLALAINLLGNGKNGVWRPSIFILQEEGKGDFPIGTWKAPHLSLTFAAATMTLLRSELEYDSWRADYTISGDTFMLSNRQTIP